MYIELFSPILGHSNMGLNSEIGYQIELNEYEYEFADI
jgi:hypothetical protein